MTSIFNDTNKMTGNWWKKEKIGDRIEGTFESKNTQINQMSGKEQMVYKIRSEQGDLYLVGGNIGIDSQMEKVKVGQIVGFEYTEERENKKNPSFAATKIVQVYANPNIVNKEWLAQQKELDGIQVNQEVTTKEAEEILNGNDEEIKIEDFKEKDEAPFLTDIEKKDVIIKITELATNKLGAINGEDVKNKVMESTELAFIDQNLSKIVVALEALPDRT